MIGDPTTPETGRLVHVTPNGDAIQHQLDDECMCWPRLEPIDDEDGTLTGWLVVHHSLDGREANE